MRHIPPNRLPLSGRITATPHKRGSALVLAIIVSVVITGLVLTMAWAAGLQASASSSLTKMDHAFYAAESGIQRVAWYCKNNKLGNITSPLTGTINGYSYSTSWTTLSGNTIRITSVGSLGSISYTAYQTVAPPGAGKPAFASGGDFDTKNIDITGDVQTGGNYSSGGSGSVTGNLIYAGTASNTNSVSGTVAKASFTSINFTTLGATLQAAAGLTYNGAQSNRTFDFTLLSGTNKVIYVNGNVTNPIFNGSGTLYVNGTISVSGFGTAANPANLVATGDITTSNNITMYGTLYSAGNWNRGKMSLTGLVYISGVSASNNGHSSLTQTSAPWFDPRSSGGSGSSTTSFTNFAGPQP